jgi:hypothetical protein
MLTKQRFFTKSFSENQFWTFIFVHFSNSQKTFMKFITLFYKDIKALRIL